MPEFAPRATRLFALLFILLFLTPPSKAATPSTRPTVQITFLNKAQGQLAILDESTDPYFKLLQPKEIWAKTGRLINEKTTEAEQDECRRRYQQVVTDFTPAEVQAVENLALQISAASQKNFPLFARTPWSFIKVHDGLEGSVPFTRGQSIVLPQSFLTPIVHHENDPVAQKQNALMLVQSGGPLIAGQLLVIQHTHRDAFAQMYRDLWHMVHADNLDPGPFLTDRQFLTPGATDQKWVYQDKNNQAAQWIWPVQLLSDIQNPAGPKMIDANATAVRLDGTPEQGFRPAKAPNGPATEPLFNFHRYIAQFSPSQGKAFNPDVAAADLFWKILIFEEMLPDPPPGAKEAIDRAKPALAQPRTWFERILSP